MSESSFSAVVFTFAIILCCEIVIANVIPNAEDDLISYGTRDRRQIPDECRPPTPPFHNHHHPHHNSDDEHRKMPPPMCCDLPNLMQGTPEAMAKCHEIVFARPHGNSRGHHNNHKHGKLDQVKRASDDSNSSEESHDSSTPAPGSFQDKKECFANCVFNMSGLLTNDGMLNEEILNQKLLEEVANNTKWATTIIDPVFKKCVAAAKEANSQSQKSCKLGPHEYLKCMTRELFFNCPSDIWVNNSDCNELKNKFEKCPNLSPPHWTHRHHHDHHHHNHHHHHESHEENKS